MASLDALERAFKAAVTGTDTALLGEIVATPALGAADRVAIYANAYRARLRQALATDYEGLAALVGDDIFAQICDAYIEAHPSTHPSLRYLGQHLPDFLEHAEPWNQEPTLGQLARFEWALVDAFDAPDATPVTAGQMATLPTDAWPGLRLGFHQSLQTIDVTYPIAALWHALKDQDTVQKPDPLPQPARILAWRHDLKTRFRTMAVDEALGLETMRKGGCFADLCERLAEWHGPAAPARAAGLLKTWLEDGLVIALSADDQMGNQVD